MFPERGVHFRCPGMENFILRTDAAGTKKLRDQVGEDVEKIAVRVSGFIANASSHSLSTEMKTKIHKRRKGVRNGQSEFGSRVEVNSEGQ